MEMIGYSTNLFKNIFPSYNSFIDWWKSTPFYDSEESPPSNVTFGLISFEYNDSHVFSSDESFKEHFAIDLYTFYQEFEATTKEIKKMLALTDEQIAQDSINIMNIANIPETESSTDIETVDFISQQQKSITKKGNLQIRREQLSSKRAFTVKTFLNRFRHLFRRIISPSYTLVIEEENH